MSCLLKVETLKKLTPQVDPDLLRAWRIYFETTARIHNELERELKQHANLHLSDYNVLLALTETNEGRMRLGDLARTVVFSPARLTYLMRSLEKRGLVERNADADDRRGTYARITDRGREVFAEARMIHLKQVEHLFISDLKKPEARVLKQIFDRVARKLGR